MDHELHHELRPKGAGQYRAEAKSLLRAVRAGDADAANRARTVLGGRFAAPCFWRGWGAAGAWVTN